MTQTVLMPKPTNSWINGICRRFSQATGWPLRVADTVPVSDPPTDEELAALRSLKTTVEEAG